MNEFYNKQKYFEQTENIPTEIYYHYTSLDALYNIVSSRAFRLTNLRSSNDRKELYYKTENFLTDFKTITQKETDSTTKEQFNLIHQSICLNKENFLKACTPKIQPYALCLSQKKDNLTHWDRYAANCTGVCIGFNVSALRVLMQRLAITSFGIGVYDLSNAIYDFRQKENFIRNSLIKILTILRDSSDGIKNNITELLQNNGYTYAASIYTQIAKFVKDTSFIDEDETRLYHDSASIKNTLKLINSMASMLSPKLYSNMKKNFKEFVDCLHLKDERFFVSSRGIRGYKELYLGEIWGSGTIPEIILGPMCVQNRKELQHFLRANGLQGTKILSSSVPIR